MAEKIRYEKIGSDKLKGIKKNIVQSYENSLKNEKDNESSNLQDKSIEKGGTDTAHTVVSRYQGSIWRLRARSLE